MRTIQMSFSEQNPGRQFYGYKDELNATEFVCDCTKLEQDFPGAKVKFTFLAPNKTARSLTLLLTPDAEHKVKVKLTRAETLIAGPVGIQAQAFVDDDVVTMTAIYPGDIGASVSGDATPPELTSSYVQQLDAKLVQLEQADSGLSSELAETAKQNKILSPIAGEDDYTSILQGLVDSIASTGGKISITPGNYIIKGTITVPKNVTIEGVVQHNDSAISAVNISHEPASADTDLFIGGEKDIYGSVGGVSIGNFSVSGNANSRYLSNIEGGKNAYIHDISVNEGFVDAVVCNGYMHSKISNIFAEGTSNSCVRFTGAISTTTIVEHCYLRGSKWSIIAEAETCLGVCVNDCISETNADGGIDIYVDNVVFINNLYAENVPSTASAKPIIQIGVNGVPKDANRPYACVSINGGHLGGFNGTVAEDSCVINCDKVASLTCIGMEALRADKLIATTANTKIVTMIGLNLTQINHTKSGIYDVAVVTIIGINENNYVSASLQIADIKFTRIGKWTLSEGWLVTEGDLVFDNGVGKPLWLDMKNNIRHNFAGACGSASKVDMFGAATTPNFTGVGEGAFLWAEEIDDVVRLKTRASDGTICDVGHFSGATTARPATPTVGQMFYDTILSKPIWYSGSAWNDAAGTAV